MRFPWLQVDLDFITAHSRDLGALLGVSRREAMGLAMDLWTWVLGRSTAAAPPDGMVRGPCAARLLAGAVDWAGDPAALLEALVGAGLAERIGDDVRVRGLSRYKATWEKNQRRNGTGPVPERQPAGTDPEPTRKTQTQTQTQKEATDLPPASQAAPRNELRLEPQEQPRKRKAREEKPTDPRHRPLLEQLVAQGWELGGPRGARAVADLLARAGETTPAEEAPGEVLRRAGHALQKRRTAPTLFPAVAELWELVTHWQHFAEPFRAPAGRGPAPPSDFEAPRPYVEPAWLDPDFGKE